MFENITTRQTALILVALQIAIESVEDAPEGLGQEFEDITTRIKQNALKRHTYDAVGEELATLYKQTGA